MTNAPGCIEKCVVMTDYGRLELSCEPGETPGLLRAVRKPDGNAERYVCGQRKGDHVLTGKFTSTEGRKVYLGCGTEVLRLNPPHSGAAEATGKATGAPYCCDMPMSERPGRLIR